MTHLLLATWLLAATPQYGPTSIVQDAFIEQRTGALAPLDAPFNDEPGHAVHFGDYLGRKPAILVLVYFSCPNLCPMALRHLTEELNGTALDAGRDFDVIVVSFDPRDTPAQALAEKKAFLAGYRKRDGDGWHFLTGGQESIDRLTSAVGFHCRFDAEHNQFVHAAALIVLTPQGRVSHYFFGVDASPADVEAALGDATALRTTRVDQPDQQYCFQFEPGAGKYSKLIERALQVAGMAWVAALLGYISLKLTQDHRGRGCSPSPRPVHRERSAEGRVRVHATGTRGKPTSPCAEPSPQPSPGVPGEGEERREP
jgi:protein SCO1/2